VFREVNPELHAADVLAALGAVSAP
jgi:hypothetical protein